MRVRFVEIIDEEILDLLASPHSKYADAMSVVYNEWEGHTITNSHWINVKSGAELSDVFTHGKMRRNTTSNEFGRVSSKSAGVFTLELIQTLEFSDTKENNVLISRVNFFDLPGSDILLEEPESLRVK